MRLRRTTSVIPALVAGIHPTTCGWFDAGDAPRNDKASKSWWLSRSVAIALACAVGLPFLSSVGQAQTQLPGIYVKGATLEKPPRASPPSDAPDGEAAPTDAKD